ncbi:hypothetical protein GGS23DRAFT_600765 [Durotheca rogersii]|uniref:uncharacterized protein n=1 Tax=Durotheca rogersii TaxID=419775 RepID=UPI00221EA715|nr:uncharacterized protein GGS23DRAFT_600765 [Durotheca rogersii]KAI5857432.1 hypothetical protein GGS23DRAFT_600765 [Durotheca rogersii]
MADTVRMPRFDLTADEQAETRRHVSASLRRCGALLADRDRDRRAPDADLPQRQRDAHSLAAEALFLAADADAWGTDDGEPAPPPPLARCNLYLGHALRGARQYRAARRAYRRGASAGAGAGAGDHRAAAQQAAAWAAEMDRKVRAAARNAGGLGAAADDDDLCWDADGPCRVGCVVAARPRLVHSTWEDRAPRGSAPAVPQIVIS